MSPVTGFLQLEDLIRDQGDVALVVEYENKFPNSCTIIAFSEILSSPSLTHISLCYFEACDTNQCTNTRMSEDCNREHSLRSTCTISSNDALLATFTAKKKYKLVAERFDRSLILSLCASASNAILSAIRSLIFQLSHPILHPSPRAVATLKSNAQKWTTYTPPTSYGLLSANYYIISSPFKTKASLGTIPSAVIFMKTSSPPSKSPL